MDAMTAVAPKALHLVQSGNQLCICKHTHTHTPVLHLLLEPTVHCWAKVIWQTIQKIPTTEYMMLWNIIYILYYSDSLHHLPYIICIRSILNYTLSLSLSL